MITSNYDPPAWPWYYGTVYRPEEYGPAAAEVKRLANRLYRGAADADRGTPEIYPGLQDPAVFDFLKSNVMEHTGKPDAADIAGSAYYFMPEYDGTKAKKPAKKALGYDIEHIRGDFPILQRQVNGRQLVWLDNAATTQKPQCVMDALTRYYSDCNSNVHRGAHTLSRAATSANEEAREKARAFLNAATREEIVFVRGTTEAINLVAGSWGGANLKPGDEIIVTQMEHHSNIVPWQLIAEKTGAVIKAAPIDDRGEVMQDQYERLFTPNTRLVALAHVSNTLGTVNPIRRMVESAHRHGALVLVDGAQSAPHMPVDVKEMDVDFFVFSGHKIYGPTGIGVLYGKRELLEGMPPYQGGGGMIKNVRIDHSTYAPLPGKFEAGTGNIADAVGMGAAIDYINGIGLSKIRQHEAELTRHLMDALAGIPGVRLIGTAPDKVSVVSFVVEGIEPESLAQALDKNGIAIRAGHHCAQPVLRRYGLRSMARASIGLYNTFEEMDFFARTVAEIAEKGPATVV
jgi:cysteine desulfurase/selenocysteine lyase